MDNNILRYIWHYSKKQQLVVVCLTVLSFPILYLSLELPKWIINDALSTDPGMRDFFGMQMEPVPFLTVLCLILLFLIIVNGFLKMRVNTHKGIIGERLVRRLRYTLIHRVLRFPLTHFSHTSSGEMVSTITAETEPLAGYIGESVALPLFQGGTMLTILVFMFAQDWVFGLVSVALIPVQGYIIPKLQKQVNLLKKERVRQVRKVSERISELVVGVEEIRLHGTEAYTLSEFSRRFGDLFWVRLEIFKKKFFMKFLNNTIGYITPFFFYLFGGYLVLKGDLTIGALVAAIGAYKDLTSPWKELLNHYQLHEDAKIKYQQILELFDPNGLIDFDEVSPYEAGEDPPRLNGFIEARNLTAQNEDGERVLQGINFSIPPGSCVAIIGDYADRRTRLAHIIAGLEKPVGGQLTVGGNNLWDISQSALRTRIAFIGPVPHIFDGTIARNLEYGLYRTPPASDESALESARHIKEAEASGNYARLQEGDWIDYRIAGVSELREYGQWNLKVLTAIGVAHIAHERSLLESFEPEKHPRLAEKILQGRRIIRKRLVDDDLEQYLSLFDPDTYNPNATVGENILYGVPIDERLSGVAMANNNYLQQTLDELHLKESAIEIGRECAAHLLKLFDDTTSSTQLLDQFELDDESKLDELREVAERDSRGKKLTSECECKLLSLFLNVIVAHHPFAKLDARIRTTLLQGRRDFNDNLPASLVGAVRRFDVDEYHPTLTVKDNLLFGRVATRDPSAERLLNTLIGDVVDQLDIRADLSLLIGESEVGISGTRLPVTARHMIALGRALIKRPDIIVFLDALSPFERSRRISIRKSIQELLPESSIIWLDRQVSSEAVFDQILEFTHEGPLNQIGGRAMVSAIDRPEAIDLQPMPDLSNDPLSLISNAVLFSRLSKVQQRYLAEHSSFVDMKGDSLIYEFGEPADAAWLVVSGEVVSEREGTPISQLGPMDVFGSIEIMARRTRMLTLKTKVVTQLLRIDANAIEDLAEIDATVSRNLLRALTDQWAGVNVEEIIRNRDD